MLTTPENKSLTTEQKIAREQWYEERIRAAMLEENHPEAKKLRAARRHELRSGSTFPPEPVSADSIRIYDARGHRDAPELVYDPTAPEKPLMIGNTRVVKTPSQTDRWKR